MKRRLHFNPSKAAPVGKAALLHLLIVASLLGMAGLLIYNDPYGERIPKIISALLGVIALIYAMWKAENGIILVILTMPLMDMYTMGLGGANFKLADWAAFAAIGFFLLRLPFDKSLVPVKDPLRAPLFLFVISGILSSLLLYGKVTQTLNTDGSTGLNSPYLRTWTQAFWAIYSIILYYVTLRIVRTRKVLQWCIGALIVASIGVGLYAVSGQRYWTGGGYRVLGTFSEPSYYAEWLILVLPVCIALSLANQLKTKLGRFGQIALIGFLMINLFLTFSTGGFASAIIALTLVMVMSLRNGLLRECSPASLAAVMSLMLLSSALIVVMAVPQVGQTLDILMGKITNPEESQHSALVRERARDAAGLMFIDYPVWGVGPGNYPFFRFDYMDEKTANDYELQGRWDPNNLYLEILSERGIIGFIPFAWIWVAYFRELYRGIKEAQDTYSKAVLVGLFASAVGLLLGYWAHANFFRIYVWMQFGIGMAAARIAREPAPSRVMASPGVDVNLDTPRRTGRDRYKWERKGLPQTTPAYNRQLPPGRGGR